MLPGSLSYLNTGDEFLYHLQQFIVWFGVLGLGFISFSSLLE